MLNGGLCPLCGVELHSAKIGGRVAGALAKRAAEIDEAKVAELVSGRDKFEEKYGGVLGSVWRYVQAFYLVLVDPRSSWTSKVLVAAALAYVISPIDLIPDFIPVIGYLDDIAVIALVAGVVGADLRRALDQLDAKARDELARPVAVYLLPDSRSDLQGAIEKTRNWILTYSTSSALSAAGVHFSGAPQPNRIYVQHPVVRNRLLELASFQEVVLQERWREYWRVMSALNASEVELEKIDSKSGKMKAKTSAKLAAIFGGTATLDTSSSEKGLFKGRATFEDSGPLSGGQVRDLLSTSIWAVVDEDLKVLIENRVGHGMSTLEVEMRMTTDSRISAKAVGKLGGECKATLEGGVDWIDVDDVYAKLTVSFHPTGRSERQLRKLEKLRRDGTQQRLLELSTGQSGPAGALSAAGG